MWWLFAVGSAVFAALTSILAKIGIEGVNSNPATAIRTGVWVLRLIPIWKSKQGSSPVATTIIPGR